MAKAIAKESAPSRDRNRDLRITCIAAIPRSTTELKKLLIGDVDVNCYNNIACHRLLWLQMVVKDGLEDSVASRQLVSSSDMQVGIRKIHRS
jgi:hypothetical protein